MRTISRSNCTVVVSWAWANAAGVPSSRSAGDRRQRRETLHARTGSAAPCATLKVNGTVRTWSLRWNCAQARNMPAFGISASKRHARAAADLREIGIRRDDVFRNLRRHPPPHHEVDGMGVHITLQVLAHQQHVAELAEVGLQIGDGTAGRRVGQIEVEMHVLARESAAADRTTRRGDVARALAEACCRAQRRALSVARSPA